MKLTARRVRKSIFCIMIIFAIETVSAEAAYNYNSTDKSCDGYPQLKIGLPGKMCIGVVADSSLVDQKTKTTFRMPRKIIQIKPGIFLITDMASWVKGLRGRIWRLNTDSQPPVLTELSLKLDRPHDIELRPDGYVYIGEVGRVLRIKSSAFLDDGELLAETVVAQLPTGSSAVPNMHPLVNFTFGAGPNDQNDLYVNIGAPSDACIKEAPSVCKIGEQQGQVRRYKYLPSVDKWDAAYVVHAKGLRNSMGLVTHTSGTILQAENSRDLKPQNEPFDEINVLKAGGHYGWPYCFNFKANSSEWGNKVNCAKDYQTPWVLLPPHSAPLDMFYYSGKMFPELKNHLVVSLHGHQPTGSVIVSFPTDKNGVPIATAKKKWSYSFDGQKRLAEPLGGNDRSSDYFAWTDAWWKIIGERAKGSPVGLFESDDGSVWIVEDKNKTILRLSKTDQKLNVVAVNDNEVKNKILTAAWLKLQNDNELKKGFESLNKNIFVTQCSQCHSSISADAKVTFEYFTKEGWLTKRAGQEATLVKRILGLDGVQKMPLGGSLSIEQTKAIQSWISAYAKK